MPFDADLVLLDGTIDFKASTDTPPTSTTRDAATGGAVIDMGKTALKGMAAVLTLPEAANGSSDNLTAFIEVSDVENFGSDVHEMGKFDIVAVTKGIILGSEVPATVVLRFSSSKRYCRFNGTVGTTPDDFGNVECNLSPYPMDVL